MGRPRHDLSRTPLCGVSHYRFLGDDKIGGLQTMVYLSLTPKVGVETRWGRLGSSRLYSTGVVQNGSNV